MRTAAQFLTFSLAALVIAAGTAHGQIAWQSNLRTAHAKAQQEGKLLLLHFYSDNCVWCDRLEEGSFKAPQVGETIQRNFVPVKIHANSAPKLAQMFKVTRFPTDVIVTTEGQTLAHSVSPQDPERYVAMLTKTVPSLADAASAPAAKIATKPSDSEAEADEQSDTDNSQAANAPPSDASVALPGYAAAAAPSTASDGNEGQASLGSSFTVPAADAGKVQARLAGSRSESSSFEMPSLDSEADLTPPLSAASDVATDATDVDIAAENSVGIEAEAAESGYEPSHAGSHVSDENAELAMEGFCAVTVISEDRWVEGSPEFGVIHLGKLYLFASEEHMQTFLADPVPYTPVLNEIDVVRFFEEREIVPGKREWGLKDPIHNRMFFFADEAAMNHFYNEFDRYTDAAIEVMDKAVKEANPVQ